MRVRLHSIWLWIGVHAALLFLVRPLQTLITGRSNLINDLDPALYIYVWLFCAVSLGTFLFAFRCVKLPVISLQADGEKIGLLRFLVAWMVWFAVWAVLLRSRFESGDLLLLLESSNDYIHGKSIFLLNTMTTLMGFFIIKSYSLDTRPTVKLLIRWTLIIFGVAAGVVSGSKTLALIPFFIVILYRSILKDGYSVAWVASGMAVVLPIVAVLNVARSGGLLSVDRFFARDGFFSQIIPMVVERFYGVDVVYQIVLHHTSMNKLYFYGQSLLQIVFAFIPSAMWADKPVISFGKVVSEEYLPAHFYGTGISAAPTIFGELFANFSWASLIVVPFLGYLFGVHIRSVLLRAGASRKHYLEYYLISFTTLAFILEVSIVGWIVQLIGIYVGIFLLNFLTTAGWSNFFKYYRT